MSWKKILLEGDAAVLSDTTPEAITENASGSAGVATEASRRDHVHASPASWTPSSHATSHKSGGGDEIDLDELGVPTGSVDFNKQEVVNMVIEQQSTAPSTPTQGQVYYDTDDDHIYVYVV